MSIRDEDPALVSLAIALSRKGVIDIPLGTPSPAEAGTPGTYFGAIMALKYLCEKGRISRWQIEELLKQDGLKQYGSMDTE